METEALGPKYKHKKRRNLQFEERVDNVHRNLYVCHIEEKLLEYMQYRRMYLHSEKGDTGEEVHCRLEVLQPLRTASWEIVLQSGKKKNTETRQKISHPSSSRALFLISMGKNVHVGVQCFLNVFVRVSEELSF